VGGEKQCPFRFEGDRPLEWMVCAMSKMTIYIWTKGEEGEGGGGGGFVYKI